MAHLCQAIIDHHGNQRDGEDEYNPQEDNHGLQGIFTVKPARFKRACEMKGMSWQLPVNANTEHSDTRMIFK